MQKRRLGRTDLHVSAICLGTMTWGEQNTEAEGHAQMDLAFERGVNFMDTAELYPIPPKPETQGRTEAYIGNWMQARKNRDKVIVATKVVGRTPSPWFRGDRPSKLVRADIFDAIDKSLTRLKTDYVDLYQVHFPERVVQWGANPMRVGTTTPRRDEDETPIAETIAVFGDLVKSGKIRNFGLSNESSWGVMRYVAESDKGAGPRPVSLQNAYNLVNRTFEVNLAETCDREAVGLLAYSPIAQGYLTGKYDHGARPAGARSTLFNRGQRYETAGAADALLAYNELARSFGVEPRPVRQRLCGEPPLRHLLDHRRDQHRAARSGAGRRRCDVDRRDAECGRRAASEARQSLPIGSGGGDESDNRTNPPFAFATGGLVIVTSHSDNVLSCTSGGWRVWSLSDGYIEMPADLLRDPQNNPVPQAAQAGALRLSVNCFALAGPGVDGVLIDSGGGGWALTVGRLERTMAEARIDPASITVLALTHTHQDHVHGLLNPDGRVLFPNLKAIAIPEAAVESFFAEAHLARFRPLLKSVRSGDQVAERLRAVALPGHAPGHTGYAFDTDEDRFLFFGDIVHVPALQFGNPAFSWGYDDDQPTARATRLEVFHDAAEAGTWIAGAHLGWPGIGRVVRRGDAYGYEPAAG